MLRFHMLGKEMDVRAPHGEESSLGNKLTVFKLRAMPEDLRKIKKAEGLSIQAMFYREGVPLVGANQFPLICPVDKETVLEAWPRILFTSFNEHLHLPAEHARPYLLFDQLKRLAQRHLAVLIRIAPVSQQPREAFARAV